MDLNLLIEVGVSAIIQKVVLVGDLGVTWDRRGPLHFPVDEDGEPIPLSSNVKISRKAGFHFLLGRTLRNP